MKVYTTDSNKRFKPHYCVNLFSADVTRFPKRPHIAWLSPPCTFFSTASKWKHWNRDHTPKSIFAVQGIKLLDLTIEILKAVDPIVWYIENPVGMMRHLPIMQQFKRHTVTYCCYGENRMKPTDIWSNDPNLILQAPCGFNKRCEISGRTNDLNTASQRSVIPPRLINTILDSAQNNISPGAPPRANIILPGTQISGNNILIDPQDQEHKIWYSL